MPGIISTAWADDPIAAARAEGSQQSQRRLIIAGFEPLGPTNHCYNELLSFKTAGEGLGLAVRIMVLRDTETYFVESLAAAPVLEPLPPMDVNADNFRNETIAFADAAETLTPLWRGLEALEPGESDYVYFPRGHPVILSGIAAWMAQRPKEGRPAVFVRIVGDELTDLQTGRFKLRAVFYRLACAELAARPGQERVFLLVNSSAKERSVSRVCRRRPFMMQHHFGTMNPAVTVVQPDRPIIYVHLNPRSGRLATGLGDIILRVAAAEPSVRFQVRVPPELSSVIAALDPEAASFAELVSPEQRTSDYLANLAGATIIFLAYEAQPYKVLTSGVFTEAASLGKPVVVPEGTWMAQKIAEGYGVGMVFEDPATESVAAVLIEAVRQSDQLGLAAREIAPRLARETGCREFLERMMALSLESLEMKLRYQVGEDIDFSDALDSRCFMGKGWGEPEPWGAWMVGGHATLTLPVAGPTRGSLVLRALAIAPLGKSGEPVRVRVSTAGRQVAEWVLEGSGPGVNQPRWFAASLTAVEIGPSGAPVDITFEVDDPASPLAKGLSRDERPLAFGICRMYVASVLP